MLPIHSYENSHDACDAKHDSRVHTGDAVLVTSEGIVGLAVKDELPVTVTFHNTAFVRVDEDDPEAVDKCGATPDQIHYACSLALALGFHLDPPFGVWMDKHEARDQTDEPQDDERATFQDDTDRYDQWAE
jgi:hypothetical protein